MSRTVISLLGTQLDRGAGPKRWNHWRPTVSIFQRDEVLVDRLLLVHPPSYSRLAQNVGDDIQTLSPETDVQRILMDVGNPWDFEEMYGQLHDLAGRCHFAEDEEVWVHISTGTHVAQICLFLLTESRHFPGVLLQTGPPRKGEDEPGTFALIDLDLARYDQLADRFDRAQTQALDFLKSGIPTRNDAFNGLMARIEQVAIASDAPVLLTGPTGAGKSQLARRMYALKRERRQISGPMVEVNCATLRGDSAMSALFGHVRGAYTGADSARPGLLRSAENGLLFLDEIGELGRDEQAMLLRAVEEKRWMPVGADREVQGAFQLIAGTHRDLRKDVADGRFREDLLARLDLWHFRLPGLADRREDIEPNLDYELQRFTQKGGRLVRFNQEARNAFLSFAMGPTALWKANFRDLNAAVTRMGTLAGGRRIDQALVDEEIGRLRYAWGGAASGLVQQILGDRADQIDPFDHVQLESVLQVCAKSSSLSEAGRALFSVSRLRRKTVNDADRLRKYLAKFELVWADVST